jgi:hypothetical protein
MHTCHGRVSGVLITASLLRPEVAGGGEEEDWRRLTGLLQTVVLTSHMHTCHSRVSGELITASLLRPEVVGGEAGEEDGRRLTATSFL